MCKKPRQRGKENQPAVITCRTNDDVMRADQSVGPEERESRFEPPAIFQKDFFSKRKKEIK